MRIVAVISGVAGAVLGAGTAPLGQLGGSSWAGPKQERCLQTLRGEEEKLPLGKTEAQRNMWTVLNRTPVKSLFCII